MEWKLCFTRVQSPCTCGARGPASLGAEGAGSREEGAQQPSEERQQLRRSRGSADCTGRLKAGSRAPFPTGISLEIARDSGKDVCCCWSLLKLRDSDSILCEEAGFSRELSSVSLPKETPRRALAEGSPLGPDYGSAAGPVSDVPKHL